MNNKKGFISTAIIFTFFITFIVLLIVIMNSYSSTRNRQNIQANDIKAKLTYENAMSLSTYVESLVDENIDKTDANGKKWGVVKDTLSYSTINSTSTLGKNDYKNITNDGTAWTWNSTYNKWQSNNHDNDSISSMNFHVSESGIYKFCYQASSESGYDKGYFYKNGSQIGDAFSGVSEGCSDGININYNDDLSFKYSKDYSDSQNDDLVRISLEKATSMKDSSYETIRYVGQNPSNYVWFNGERWRIIGVFGEETTGIAGEKLVKIIRNDSIGNLSWDYKSANGSAKMVGSSSSSNGSNDWSDSQLMMMLNPNGTLNTGYDQNGAFNHEYSLTFDGSNVSTSTYVSSTAGSSGEQFTCSGTTCTSNTHEDSSNSEISFKLPEEGKYQFCYTVSSELGWDKGYFYVDNTSFVTGVSGTESKCIYLGTINTSNTLKAVYGKDSGTSKEHDNFSFYIVKVNDMNTIDEKGQLIYQNMGSYFDSSLTAYKPASATYDGTFEKNSIELNRLSQDAQNMIQSVNWKISGTNNYSNTALGKPSDFFAYERNINNLGQTYTTTRTVTYLKDNPRPFSWYGKVGLMYASDFNFATSGDNESTYTRDYCLQRYVNGWSSGDYKNICTNNSWLYYNNATSDTNIGTGSNQWTLTPYSDSGNSVHYLRSNGRIQYQNANTESVVRPVVYLKSNVEKTGGSGTYSDPFKIEINSEKRETLSTYLMASAPSDEFIYDHGYRFIGQNPNNWACLGSCSTNTKFRIVGVFNEEYDSDNDGEVDKNGMLVKLILRTYKVSSKWNDSQDNSFKGSVIQNYLIDSYMTTLSSYVSKIANVKWYLGSIDTGSSTSKKAYELYNYERNNSGAYSMPNQKSIVSNVGLLYPSDYGFANNGGKDSDGSLIKRRKCLDYSINNWYYDGYNSDYSSSGYYYCADTSWLYYVNSSSSSIGSKKDYWLMNSASNNAKTSYLLNTTGYLGGRTVTSTAYVRPVIYLRPEVTISNGDGTYNNPYILN